MIIGRADGATFRIRMPGNDEHSIFAERICYIISIGDFEPEGDIIGWCAVRSRCIGLTRLHNRHADTVFWAVIADTQNRPISAVEGVSGVADACTFEDQAGMLPCTGTVLEGGQDAGIVPLSGTQNWGGVLRPVAAASVTRASCTLPHLPQERVFSGRSAPQ